MIINNNSFPEIVKFESGLHVELIFIWRYKESCVGYEILVGDYSFYFLPNQVFQKTSIPNRSPISRGGLGGLDSPPPG